MGEMLLLRPRTSAWGWRITASPDPVWAKRGPTAPTIPITPPSQRTYRIGRLPSRDRTTAFRPRIIGPRRPGPSAVRGRGGWGRGGFAEVAARGVGYTRGSGSHKSSRTAARAGRASGADPGGRVNSPEPDAPIRRNRDVADYTYADI